jgi:hypothetical protein
VILAELSIVYAMRVNVSSKMQNPRHLCKFLILRLALYKQPHLAQFRMIETSIGTMEQYYDIPYYKWSAGRTTLRNLLENTF